MYNQKIIVRALSHENGMSETKRTFHGLAEVNFGRDFLHFAQHLTRKVKLCFWQHLLLNETSQMSFAQGR